MCNPLMTALHRNVREILKGSLPYFVSGILNSAAPFAVSLLVSWYLGKEALGLFSICFALVLAGILVSDLGLNSLILREFAGRRSPESMNLRTLLFIRCLVSILTGAGVVAAARLFISSTGFLVLASTAFSLIIIRSVASTLENVIKALLFRTAYAGVMISGSVAHVGLVYLVLASGRGIDGVFLVMAGVEAAKTVLMMWMNREDLRPSAFRPLVTVQTLSRLFLRGLPFALIGIFTLLNEKSALFFLSKICGNAEAGIYSAADRFLIIGTLIDSSLFASAFPILSLFRGDAQFHHVTKQTLSIAFVLGVLGALVLYLGAPFLIRLSFRYSEATGLLRILSFSLPALLWNSVVRIALFSLHRERNVATVFGLTCVLNVAANLLVVPLFASTGAAVVSVLTEYCISAAYGFLYLRSASRNAVSLKQEFSKALS